MNATARQIESVELELLHGAVFEREVWTLAIEAGLHRDHLYGQRSRRVYDVLEAHYAATTESPGDAAVLVARGLLRDDAEAMGVLAAGSKGAPQLTHAIMDAAAERERKRTMKRAEAALAEGDAELARHLIDQAQRERAPGIVWLDTAAIFAPLPPTPWKVQGLHIGPGRPTLIAGYGASAKTLSAQALALSSAAGALVWGQYHTTPMHVRHLDYEQGYHATAKRYQRLAIGSGINPDALDNRLQLCVFPSVFLDSAGAVDAYARACDGAELVIIDALRGAAPTQDENDSAIRRCIDHLTLVSERTGAAFIVLHHAGKPKDAHSDARTVARGSSAIFDAAGCVLLLSAGKAKTDPRRVTQAKVPAEAEGAALEDFDLVVEDVPIGMDPAAGVRVLFQPVNEADPQTDLDERLARDCDRVLAVVQANAGASQRVVRASAGLGNQRVAEVLAVLEHAGRIVSLPGKGGGKAYRTAGGSP